MGRDINFFDCNSMLGSCGFGVMRSFDSLEELTEYSENYGIQKALVYSALAKYGDPQEGNRALIRELHNSKSVVPCAVAVPHHTGGFPAPDEFCRFLQYNNIKAVRIFPCFYGLTLDIWLWEDLLRELEKGKIPLFIDFSIKHWSEDIDWNGVSGICKAFPELPVIIIGIGPRADRFIFPLFAKHKNLRMDTSCYIAHRGIENISRIFGTERLLFGSGMPLYNLPQPMTVVILSRLKDIEADNIAGANLAALMEEVELDVY